MRALSILALSILALASACSDDGGSSFQTACTRHVERDKECDGYGTTKGFQIAWTCPGTAAGSERWLEAKEAGGKGCMNQTPTPGADPVLVCCPP